MIQGYDADVKLGRELTDIISYTTMDERDSPIHSVPRTKLHDNAIWDVKDP